ncbi:hypothetical protein QBZ16_004779 [Prototheca wickerhamii]|uniref:Tubulin-specific chaperone A n=1 Tax=Prototheca wickerhamii TaxID=3111 RepID=A0AAD9MJW2_PROWI|nr:hypothetical protein QBZ16_004779 [Prototheca wickerhamii]
MYVDEQAKETQKVEKLRSDGADPHDIKYAENILAESSAMIPDTRQRLEQACEQLQAALEDAPPNVPEVAAAQEELQLATETLNGQGV